MGGETDVEALLTFKRMKDGNHPEAVAIWSRYQSTGNEGALNREIMDVIRGDQSGRSRTAPAPPGGIDSFPDAGECCFILRCRLFRRLTHFLLPHSILRTLQVVRS